jgi:hypothetical protein
MSAQKSGKKNVLTMKQGRSREPAGTVTKEINVSLFLVKL